MHDDDVLLRDNLADIFAIVPDEDAIASSRAVVEAWHHRDESDAAAIKWVEFSASGKFSRGGVASLPTMSTRLLADWRDDADLAAMARLVEDGEAGPGRVLAASNSPLLYWFVPFTAPPDSKSGRPELPEPRMRGICVTERLLTEVTTLFNGKAGLTPAEQHIIFQISGGLNPSTAAQADSVSVETKRSQLKRVCAKLHCGGQSGLMRLIVGQMIHILSLCEAESSGMEITERFTADFLDPRTRLSVQRLSNGRLMRFWELGPLDGRPLLMIHGYLSPCLLIHVWEQLERHHIRLIVPVRAGYLDEHNNGDTYHGERLVDETIEDLILFAQQTLPTPLDVFGHMAGSLFAMMLAAREPNLVASLTINSLHLMQRRKDSGTMVGNFFDSVRKLSGQDGVIDGIVRQFQKAAFSSETAFRILVGRMFKSSSADLGVLTGKDLGAGSYGWWKQLHTSSPLGIANDFRLGTNIEDDLLAKTGLPVTFLHGRDNPLTSVAEVQQFIEQAPTSRLEVLPGGGHLYAASHAEATWDLVVKSLRV